MKSLILPFAFLIGICLCSCNMDQSPAYEIVIKGGMVNTGEGSPSIVADIGINADTIAYIGEINTRATKYHIDAAGLVVAPGFIDMHVHLESIFKYPDAKNIVTQGVTLALGGPDGWGFWPFKPYLDSLSEKSLGINVAYLLGHNKIREVVMQMENRDPTDDELIKMNQMVSQGMEEGAFGLSTGLKYLPGAFSKVNELVQLSKVVSSHGGIYTSHLREEGLGLKRRGRLQVGHFADITIFDPNTISDKATYLEPHQYSQGIQYVLVNGVLTIDKGEFNDKRGGEILKREEF